MRKVLFVCVGNSARSQMAEGFFNHFAAGKAEAMSGGTSPAEAVAEQAVEAMDEVGIDISGQKPKAVTAEMLEEAEYTISMGCGVDASCPVLLGAKIDEDWELDDPYGKTSEEVRRIRDEIRKKVMRLLERFAI